MIEQRRIAASIAACINIPIEQLEDEHCLVERMLDSISTGGLGLRHRPEKAERARPKAAPVQPVLTDEMREQMEKLQANANSYFSKWQEASEIVNRLTAEKQALAEQVERLMRKAR